MKEALELTDCTFSPDIGTSKDIVNEIAVSNGSDESKLSVFDRLGENRNLAIHQTEELRKKMRMKMELEGLFHLINFAIFFI